MILWMYEEKQYVVIQEEHRAYKIKTTTCKKIIEELCFMYGTTYEGSRHAICHCLQITKNAPILISFYLNIMLFPINNGNKGRWWMNYAYVEQVLKKDDVHTTLFMKQGLFIDVETSYRSMNRQIQRCKMYLRILETFNIQDYLNHIYTTQGCIYEN